MIIHKSVYTHTIQMSRHIFTRQTHPQTSRGRINHQSPPPHPPPLRSNSPRTGDEHHPDRGAQTLNDRSSLTGERIIVFRIEYRTPIDSGPMFDSRTYSLIVCAPSVAADANQLSAPLYIYDINRSPNVLWMSEWVLVWRVRPTHSRPTQQKPHTASNEDRSFYTAHTHMANSLQAVHINCI